MLFRSTPEETHFVIASEALKKGMNVFVEKPLALQKKHAAHLIELAKKYNLTLFTDYIFLFDPVARAIKKTLFDGELGELLAIRSTRLRAGVTKSNVSIYDDAAIHDIYLARHFFDRKIKRVTALPRPTADFLPNFGTAFFEISGGGKYIAEYSWQHHQDERKMMIFGSLGYLSWEKHKGEDVLWSFFSGKKPTKRIFRKDKGSPLEKTVQFFLEQTNSKNKKSAQELLNHQHYLQDVAMLESLRG